MDNDKQGKGRNRDTSPKSVSGFQRRFLARIDPDLRDGALPVLPHQEEPERTARELRRHFGATERFPNQGSVAHYRPRGADHTVRILDFEANFNRGLEEEERRTREGIEFFARGGVINTEANIPPQLLDPGEFVVSSGRMPGRATTMSALQQARFPDFVSLERRLEPVMARMAESFQSVGRALREHAMHRDRASVFRMLYGGIPDHPDPVVDAWLQIDSMSQATAPVGNQLVRVDLRQLDAKTRPYVQQACSNLGITPRSGILMLPRSRMDAIAKEVALLEKLKGRKVGETIKNPRKTRRSMAGIPVHDVVQPDATVARTIRKE